MEKYLTQLAAILEYADLATLTYISRATTDHFATCLCDCLQVGYHGTMQVVSSATAVLCAPEYAMLLLISTKRPNDDLA